MRRCTAWRLPSLGYEGLVVWLLDLMFCRAVPGGGIIIVANFIVGLPGRVGA